MEFTAANLSLIVGGLLVLSVLVYALRDLGRFSFYRAWAIGGVVFRESIRRRVLWVTPLAMLGTLLMIRLQAPADEQDAIRQAIKFCLFASGLVVVVVSLVLACTNLPREIDSRVIYTIVTKPLTRLELLLGKIIGFARLTALVLLIMGLFSWVLLQGMNWVLVNRIERSLAAPLPLETRRPYLEYLAAGNLLRSEHVHFGDDLQVYAEAPADPGDEPTLPRFMYPGQYYAAYPFRVEPELAVALWERGDVFLAVDLRLPWKAMPLRQLIGGDPPFGIVSPEFLEQVPVPPPSMGIQVLGGLLENLISPASIAGNSARLPRDPSMGWEQAGTIALREDQVRRLLEETEEQRQAEGAEAGTFYIATYGLDIEYLYGATADGMRIRFIDRAGNTLAEAYPDLAEGPRASILMRTYQGSFGLGLMGPEEDLPPPVGVLAFRNTPPARPTANGRVGIEMTVGIEHIGGILEESDESRMEAMVHNIRTGYRAGPVVLYPETGRPVHLHVPPEAVEGGNFDLHLQTLTRGQIISVSGSRIVLITGQEPFALNLFKGLLVLWLLSLLVVVSGLTFSTFVSWPIAVTLTSVGLLGRWVAEQLGSALDPGSGRLAAETILGGEGDTAAREVVRVSVDALNETFRTITNFLPDIGVYAVGEAVERGLAVSWVAVGQAGWVTLAFSLPFAALAYVVLRNKEVAP